MHALLTDLSRGNILAGNSARTLLMETARRAWSARERMDVCDWAEKFRILPEKVSEVTGLVDLDKTPYLRGFMRSFQDPMVRKITVKKASQLGFTMALDTLALYCVDQMPTPLLWICPNAELSRDAAKTRIEPGAKACPAVRDRMGQGRDDATTKELDFDLMRMRFVGAGNRNNLRSRPCGIVVIDDFELCEDYTLAEAQQRVAAFEESKILMVSPPSFEGVGIARQYELSDKRRYFVPCWSCGFEHVLTFENARWEGGLEADPDAVEKTTRMVCPNCKKDIENHHKPAAMRAGEWRAEAPHVVSHRGFEINSFYSPWQTFGWVVRDFVEARGKPERTWRNGKLGLEEKNPAAIEIKDLEELAKGSRLVEGLEKWTRRRIPDEACSLIATVDIQNDYVYVLVTAWSEYGLKCFYVDHFVRPLPENAKLDPVYVLVRERKYQRMDGRWMRIVMQAWDTGHRATDTHAVWLARSRDKSHVFTLVKGMPSLNMTKLWRYAAPEDMGENTKARAAGVRLLQLNTTQWKNRVWHALRSALATVRQLAAAKKAEKEGISVEELAEEAPPSPTLAPDGASLAAAAGLEEQRVGVILGKTAAAGEGVMTAFFVPPDVPRDFLEHLASEHVQGGRWLANSDHVRNEGWDTAYYAAGAGDAAGLRDIGRKTLGSMLVGAPSEEQARAWGLRVERGVGGGAGVGVGIVDQKIVKNAEPRAARSEVRKPGELRPAGKKALMTKGAPDLKAIRAKLAMRLRRGNT